MWLTRLKWHRRIKDRIMVIKRSEIIYDLSFSYRCITYVLTAAWRNKLCIHRCLTVLNCFMVVSIQLLQLRLQLLILQKRFNKQRNILKLSESNINIRILGRSAPYALRVPTPGLFLVCMCLSGSLWCICLYLSLSVCLPAVCLFLVCWQCLFPVCLLSVWVTTLSRLSVCFLSVFCCLSVYCLSSVCSRLSACCLSIYCLSAFCIWCLTVCCFSICLLSLAFVCLISVCYMSVYWMSICFMSDCYLPNNYL